MPLHRRLHRPLSLLALGAAYLTLSGYNACTGNILEDDGFDLWCGEALCSWTVEQGAVRKAASWHAGDHAVELVGDGAAISQHSAIDNWDVTCIRFEILADVAEDASVALEMDLDDDGAIDFARELPAARWAPLVYTVRLPYYDGVRFRLRKAGGGRAVLAQLDAVRESDCAGAPAIEQPLRPDGAGCGVSLDPPTNDGVCASGRCGSPTPFDDRGERCVGCATDADCEDDQVCGVELEVPLTREVWSACVAPASKEVGQRCAIDGECATGLCCGYRCSTCCPGGDACPDEAACGQPTPGGPYLCPAAATDAPCVADADCASGVCAGDATASACWLDGRTCDDDADCPAGVVGGCGEIGIAGGRCE